MVRLLINSSKTYINAPSFQHLLRFYCNTSIPHLSRNDTTNDNTRDSHHETAVQQYDIAIVGGGLVGMALASSLASSPVNRNLKVAIIDDNPALTSGGLISKEKPPDPRVSTITPATISFLEDIGAWKYVEQQRHAYFDKMQVWDYTGLGYTRYNARDVNKKVLGCVVENKVLHSSLSLCMQDKDFQKTVLPSRLSSMELQSNVSSTKMGSQLAKLELEDGSKIATKLVAISKDLEIMLHINLGTVYRRRERNTIAVGADGGRSRVRELARFSASGTKYSQKAIICTVEHLIPNSCAWQRFLPSGPLALLPIGDNFSNIVWTMSPQESSDRKVMTEDEFVKAVNHAMDYGYGPHPQSKSNSGIGKILSSFMGDLVSSNESFEVPPKVIKLASERMVFPLSLVHADSYAKTRVVLVGDAAHTVHPLAGQGVNLGFSDASALSKVISEGTAVGVDIGQVSLLQKYEQERKVANTTMATILDSIQKAYTVDFGPLNALRALGFQGAQLISPLKRNIILYASGERKLPFFV